MRSLFLIPLLLSSFLSAAVENDQAYTSLEKLSQSLRSLNFTTSFVVVKNNNAEPYHWSHGINEDNAEVEVLSILNGPHRDVVRRNNIVSYLESGIEPYSVNSAFIASPIPEIFSGNTEKLIKNYDLVSAGRSRILGRVAQFIRIIPKDPFRYGHWVWLDKDSGLLLKLAVINDNGQVLEQIQFTHLELDETINPSLQQIELTDLPTVIDLPDLVQKQDHAWGLSWLPEGFVEINANTHRIMHTKQPTEFKMFSDGLVDFSVYVSPSQDENRPSGFAQDGATIAFNEVINGIEVSVVGKIPASTAQKIASSLIFKVTP